MRLGELEKLLLNHFWSVSEADAKQVHEHFVKQRGGTLNTIQSTLDRLYRKGLLVRKKKSHAYYYSAALSRSEFIGLLVRNVTRDFITEGEDNLVAAFVSLSADMDEEQLADLESVIRDFESRETSGDEKHD